MDAYGNVFGHPGLHIADGSVMPGPTGRTPGFTIAALADRFADQDTSIPTDAAEADGHMTSTFRFTEEMLGHVTFGEPTRARRPAEPRRRSVRST